MGRRKLEYVEAGLCGKGLHAWVDGQRKCQECRRAAGSEYWRQHYRSDNEHTRNRAAGLCVKGLHAWVDGQPRCQLCVAIAQEKWRAENARKVQSYHDKRVSSGAQYRATAKWRMKNVDRARDYSRKRRAQQKNNGTYAVTAKDWRKLNQQPCAHAHLGPCQGRLEVDHIVPIARGGSHSIGNLQMLCRSHNATKNNKLEVELRVA